MTEEYLVQERRLRDGQASGYESFISEYQHRCEWENYSALMSGWSGTVLDLGCGTGRFGRRLVEAGFDVISLDFSEASVALARSKAPSGRYCTSDVRFVPLRDRSVDGVLCAQVCEHLLERDDVVRLFGEIRRVLKTRRRAVISTYAFSWLDMALGRNRWMDPKNIQYVRYSRKELSTFADGAGLALRSMREVVLFTRNPFWRVCRLLPPAGLLTADAVLSRCGLGRAWGAFTVLEVERR